VVSDVQLIDNLGNVLPNVLMVTWQWKWLPGYLQVVQMTHIVIAKNHFPPVLTLPLHSMRASLEEVVKIHGVSRVGDIHCEEVPLFPVSFSSENSLRKFLINRDPAQQQLKSLLPVRLPTHDQQPGSDELTFNQHSASSQQPASDQLPTHVQLQLFLVSPDAVTKDARVVEVTLENHSACMALFKESEMFDYWSLFQAYRTKINKTPSQGMV